MGTVVAFESRDGVVIAGDTRAVSESTVTGEHVQRVFDVDDVGVGAVGEQADVQAFRRAFERELRTERVEGGGDLGVEKLGRIAARHADAEGVAAVVAARDADGSARLREVDPDGGALESPSVALGDGAEIAYGQLETLDTDVALEDAEASAADVLAAVQRRDAHSGGDVDVWSLADAADADTGEP